ncbi:unnamed protein product, partial [Ectocarpus sp. 8 AP-2014]
TRKTSQARRVYQTRRRARKRTETSPIIQNRHVFSALAYHDNAENPAIVISRRRRASSLFAGTRWGPNMTKAKETKSLHFKAHDEVRMSETKKLHPIPSCLDASLTSQFEPLLYCGITRTMHTRNYA